MFIQAHAEVARLAARHPRSFERVRPTMLHLLRTMPWRPMPTSRAGRDARWEELFQRALEQQRAERQKVRAKIRRLR